MLRRLFRLLLFVALLALAAWAVSRFLNREEDFEDYEDIDSTLDFTETPVEIDVPYEAGMATDKATVTSPSSASEAASTPAPARASRRRGSVIDVNGIGPTYAARLKEIGIGSLDDLASASADDIAGKMEVIGGHNEVQDWIEQARKMTSGSS